MEMETVDLLNIPIFSTGIWEGKGSAPGGDNIDEKFLDEIVTSFQKIGNRIKPRMVLTHNKGASQTATGMASLGWITNLRRNANILYADIRKIPKKIADLIDNGAFARFSPGVWSKINLNGATYNNVLEHLALLGADLPANTDLDGLVDLYYSKDEYTIENFVSYETENESKIIGNNEEKSIQEEDMEDQKIQELMEEIKNLKDTNKELTEKVSNFEKEKEDIALERDKLQEKIESEKQNAYSQKVESSIDKWIEDGKILPSQKHAIQALASEMGNEKTFSYNDGESIKELKGNNFDLIKTFIDNQPNVLEFKQKSEQNEIDKSEKTDDDKLHEKAMDYMKENKDVDYKNAILIVSRES